MINLNDSSHDAKSVAIFNDGQAGIAENVTLDRIEPKQDPTSNQPDWKMFFKDEAGHELSLGLYALDNTNQWYEKNFKKQTTLLKHFGHAFIDPAFTFPQYANEKAMLDGVMGLIRDAINHTVKYRVYTNYGYAIKPSNFLSLRSYAPCVEPMTVPAEETRLKASKIEMLTRLQADETSAPAATAPTNVDADW